MRRLLLSLSAAALITGFIAPPSASAQQSLNLFVGGFVPKGLDSRGDKCTNRSDPGCDVLFANGDFLVFDIKEFTGPVFGAEWLVGLGDLFDAGLGVGFYQRTSPAVYRNFTNANGSEIEQDLKLRIVPITATLRFLPLGHHGPVQPYIGGGVGIFAWRYSEAGDFLDLSDRSIFRDTFVEKHTTTGPVVLGGVIFPIGNAGIGVEARYQSAKGDLPGPPTGFGGAKIDLGGMNYLFLINFRF